MVMTCHTVCTVGCGKLVYALPLVLKMTIASLSSVWRSYGTVVCKRGVSLRGAKIGAQLFLYLYKTTQSKSMTK